MHVFFVDPEPVSQFGGGIRTYIKSASRLCANNGMEIAIYSHNPEAYPADYSHAIQRQKFGLPGFRRVLYYFAYSFSLYLEFSKWLAWEFSKAEQSSIFEFCDYGGYAFFSLRNKHIRNKCVIRVHTPLYLILRYNIFTNFKIGIYPLMLMEKYCLKTCSNITVPSMVFIQEKLTYINTCTYIPNPYPQFPKVQLRAAMNPQFLYVGRVEKRKGVHILIQSFADVLKCYPDAELGIAGSWANDKYGNMVRCTISNLISDRKARITIHGEVSKSSLANLFLKYSFCIFPSLWENCPYAFFEAMAHGIYCLGSLTGEMKTVQHAIGHAGFLPADQQSLTKAMIDGLNISDYSQGLKRQMSYLENQGPYNEELLLSYYKQLKGFECASA